MPDSSQPQNNQYPWWKLYSLLLGFLLLQIVFYYWLTIRWH
ncbi:hypothetical protein [Cesiribacter andamanensis]|uniref:Uncharacterized protein n=1 Tax=Cesiribacter andamanensis AMV16 TaxID=1279009 RepID=M7P1I4_9BACT|nr:hypothetical protein [Cesiribacter andamanensis]EMR04474.1 hypothetical protein ADICEAN_00372 [Cesiribacter andamanensis AMV16]